MVSCAIFLGLIVVYMILSEWPKGSGRGRTVLARLWDGWASLLAGLATFCLSGLLGLMMTYRSLVPLEVSFQGLMPAFMGLFAIPWVLQNIISAAKIPKQHICRSVDVTPALIARGVGAGTLGGLLAAFFPLVTLHFGPAQLVEPGYVMLLRNLGRPYFGIGLGGFGKFIVLKMPFRFHQQGKVEKM